ncbi:hypothetical protein V5799_002588 [Amblyomma americanum]|uniref:Uncharacterized protein n=1 Tax=Amblyomma americanum TaxID=6943 RepID=A0AAQ4CWX9_AMBAM
MFTEMSKAASEEHQYVSWLMQKKVFSSPKELGGGGLDRAEGRGFADSVVEFGATIFESLEGFDFGSPDGCVTDAEGNLECTAHDYILFGNDMA